MQKDYWVYQKRQSDTNQWALYVVKDTDRKTKKRVLDVTVFSDDIEQQPHSKSVTNIESRSIYGYVHPIIKLLESFTTVTRDDQQQLYNAVMDILID